MIHTNGHLLCAVDVETTGADPMIHEIFQLAILPLDSNLNVLRTVEPFYMNITPLDMEVIDPRALKITKTDLAYLIKHSLNTFVVMDLLDEWFNRLELPITTNQSKKIMPVWSNGDFDKAMLISWLGKELYDTYFYFHERDTQHSALQINDRFYQHGDKVPFPKVGLSYLANCFDIDTSNAHDALADCLTTAEVYKKLCMMQMPMVPGACKPRTVEI
jgi:exonuclease I